MPIGFDYLASNFHCYYLGLKINGCKTSKTIHFIQRTQKHSAFDRFMPQGTVKWFNQVKGFGFIEQEGGEDLFVHISQVEGEITDGDTVEFEIGEGPKGPNAINVSKVE